MTLLLFLVLYKALWCNCSPTVISSTLSFYPQHPSPALGLHWPVNKVTNPRLLLSMTLFQHPDLLCLELFHTNSLILTRASNHFIHRFGLAETRK